LTEKVIYTQSAGKIESTTTRKKTAVEINNENMVVVRLFTKAWARNIIVAIHDKENLIA
jgi:hypothetical protein